MRYCFDTSAINRLLDDPACDAIATALLETGTVRISAFNVLEAAKTKDERRRYSLVRLMWRLADYKRPLDRPHTLVRAAARSYAERSPDGKATVTANIDPDLDGVWAILNAPDALDEDSRREVIAWASQWEAEYDQIAFAARDSFQALIAKYPDGPRPTLAFTMRSYLRNVDHVFELLVKPIYERETGHSLSRAEFEQ